MLSACYWFLLLLSTSFMFSLFVLFFFFNYPATSEIYTLSLHDALPILRVHREIRGVARSDVGRLRLLQVRRDPHVAERHLAHERLTRLHQLTDLDALLAHHPFRGGGDTRVGQVEGRLVARRAGRGHPRVRAEQRRLCGGQPRRRRAPRRLGGIERLLRDDVLLRQRLDALEIA